MVYPVGWCTQGGVPGRVQGGQPGPGTLPAGGRRGRSTGADATVVPDSPESPVLYIQHPPAIPARQVHPSPGSADPGERWYPGWRASFRRRLYEVTPICGREGDEGRSISCQPGCRSSRAGRLGAGRILAADCAGIARKSTIVYNRTRFQASWASRKLPARETPGDHTRLDTAWRLPCPSPDPAPGLPGFPRVDSGPIPGFPWCHEGGFRPDSRLPRVSRRRLRPDSRLPRVS